MDTSRTRRRRTFGGAILAVLTVWLIAVVASSVSARDQLEQAGRELRAARLALGSLDVDAAQPHIQAASRLVRSAHASVHSPHVTVGAMVPVVGNSLRTGRTVADAARQVVTSVEAVADAVASLPGGRDGLQPTEGRLPVEAFEALAGPLRGAAAAVAAAREQVAASPSTWLVSDAREGRAELLELTTEVEPNLAVAAAVTEQLPALLGADAPRRYLLLAANPAELRGVGGFPGAHALLTIDGGRLSIGGFRPIWQLPRARPGEVEPPSTEFASRYGKYGGTWSWLNQNLTPDFPTSATMMERLWEATGNDPVDGTILVDPFAFETLLHLTGAVDLEETGKNLRAGNVVDYVTNGSFADLADPAERKDVIGEVAGQTLTTFLAGGVPIERRTIRFLADMFEARHVVVHARDPGVQAALDAAGLTGRLQDPGRGVFVNVTLNSGTASKVDYWLDRSIRSRVTVLDEGAARVDLEVELRNGAPTSGEPRQTIGPNDPELEAGENRLWVNVYCGSRCSFEQADPGTQEGTVVQRELGQAVAATWVDIPAGETVTLRYRFVVAEAWWQGADGPEVALIHQRQSAVRAAVVEFTVPMPAEWTPRVDHEDWPDDARIRDAAVSVLREGRDDVDVLVPFRTGGR